MHLFKLEPIRPPGEDPEGHASAPLGCLDGTLDVDGQRMLPAPPESIDFAALADELRKEKEKRYRPASWNTRADKKTRPSKTPPSTYTAMQRPGIGPSEDRESNE